MELITSRNNETVKRAAALKDAAERRERGLFLLEGARLCADAANSAVQIEQAFFTESALQKYARTHSTRFKSYIYRCLRQTPSAKHTARLFYSQYFSVVSCAF